MALYIRSAIVFIVAAALSWLVLGAVLGPITYAGLPLMAIGFGGMAVGLVFALANNRKVVRVDAATRTALLAEPAPADGTAVLVFRQGYVGWAVGVDVTVDGITVAQLKSPACTRLVLAPGVRRIGARSSADKGRAPVTLELAANGGETLAVQIEFGFGKISLKQQTNLEALRRQLAKTAMVRSEQSTA